MADLSNLLKIIPEGQSVAEFGKAIFKQLKFKDSKDRALAVKAVKQLISGKSIKHETLGNIAKATGKDYNEILNYEKSKRKS